LKKIVYYIKVRFYVIYKIDSLNHYSHIVFFTGKANGEPPVFAGPSGFDSHPEILGCIKTLFQIFSIFNALQRTKRQKFVLTKISRVA